jgi:hypothetical protein
MWSAWVNDPGWDELRRIPEIRCEGKGWSNDPVLTRQRLLQTLSTCESGTWYSIPQVIQSIREHAPDFQRTGGDYDSWYIRDAKSGEYLMGFEHWSAIEGRLVAQVIAGPLHWLGAADLGQDDSGADLAFSLTPLGWAWLRGQETESEGGFAPLVIRDNAQIQWPPGGNLYHRFQLERFADWKGDEGGSLYEISPSSLARVLTQGVDAKAIIGFLQRAGDGQVPADMAERIEEWAGRRGRAKLSRAMLLETDSPSTMEKIRADAEISQRLGELISPTCIRVPETEWREVLSILRKKGFAL